MARFFSNANKLAHMALLTERSKPSLRLYSNSIFNCSQSSLLGNGSRAGAHAIGKRLCFFKWIVSCCIVLRFMVGWGHATH